MNKTAWIVAIVAVLAIGGLAITMKDRSGTPETASEQQPTVSYQGEAGKNALELLKAKAAVETTTDPSLGEYVTSVNGVKSGTNGRYWLYYVNGQPAAVGAADYETSATDTIEWKLE